MTTTYSDLIADLRRRLVEYKYSEFEEIHTPNIRTLNLIMTQELLMVRYICAVFEVPDTITTAPAFAGLFNQIRNQLSARYGSIL